MVCPLLRGLLMYIFNIKHELVVVLTSSLLNIFRGHSGYINSYQYIITYIIQYYHSCLSLTG